MSVRHVAVVVTGDPGALEGGLHARDLVHRPVVGGRGQPHLGEVLALVRVVTRPEDALLVCRLTGCRRVLRNHTNDVGAIGNQCLGRLALECRIEPGVRPDQLHRCVGIHCTGAERPCIDAAKDFRNRVRREKSELAGLRCRARSHARQPRGILCRAGELRQVRCALVTGGELEADIRVLLGRSNERILESERGAEDHRVAVGDEVFDDLQCLVTFGNVFLVGRDDVVTEFGLHRFAALVVGGGPTTVVDRADVDPGSLQRLVFALAARTTLGRRVPRSEVGFPRCSAGLGTGRGGRGVRGCGGVGGRRGVRGCGRVGRGLCSRVVGAGSVIVAAGDETDAKGDGC